MGRKAGITLEDVAVAGAKIADRDGLDAATLTAVATELGIKTPSLYNHVEGLDGLRRQIALHGARRFTEVIKEAIGDLQGAEALRSVAAADREFATRHPGLFEAFLPAPKPEEDEELYNAMAEPVFLIAYVLLDMGIPREEAFHLIRALRALLHGFLDLEAKGGFGPPVDLDASFDASIELMIDGLVAAANRHSE